MVSPIYETTAGNTEGITKLSVPSGSRTILETGGGVDAAYDSGMAATIMVVDEMTEIAAPKNDPTTWSAGK